MILVRSRSLVALLAAVLAVAPALRAQIVLPGKGEALPSFEVDTVKPSSRDLGRSFHVSIWWDDNAYRTENTTLRNLIRTAFNVGSDAQLSGGPDELLDTRFDLSAKISDDDFARQKKLPDEERDREMHLMVQSLLADRFGLKVHTETRELPVFDLVVDKGGSKLQPVADPAPAPAGATQDSSSAPAAPAARPSRNVRTHISNNQATMTASDADVESLVTMLNRQAELGGRIVIDRTGLAGKYNYTLQWSVQHPNATADPDADGPPLFTALREQLGLRLESSKGSVEVVIIDAVSAPTPN
jgi:uncharacterized protein (TIGR03435 family)